MSTDFAFEFFKKNDHNWLRKMVKKAFLIFLIGMNLFLCAEANLKLIKTPVTVNKRDLLGLLENIFDQRNNFLKLVDCSESELQTLHFRERHLVKFLWKIEIRRSSFRGDVGNRQHRQTNWLFWQFVWLDGITSHKALQKIISVHSLRIKIRFLRCFWHHWDRWRFRPRKSGLTRFHLILSTLRDRWRIQIWVHFFHVFITVLPWETLAGEMQVNLFHLAHRICICQGDKMK